MSSQRSNSTFGISATRELCASLLFLEGDFFEPTILLPRASSDSLDE